MKTGLLGIKTFVIPSSLLEETLSFLRSVGVEGFEGFVLWSGEVLDDSTFAFRTSIVPEQRAMMTESGLLVTVDGAALFEVNKAVHDRKETLAAQVHSHPTEAYHSSTDDTFPLVTLLGGLSVVVPDFAANAPQDIEWWAWYRLSERNKWEPASLTTMIEVV